MAAHLRRYCLYPGCDRHRATSGDIVFTLGAIAIVLFTVRAIYAIFQSGNSPAGTPAKEER